MKTINDVAYNLHYKYAGIYKLIVDNKFYIGSSQNIKKRVYDHLDLLQKKVHCNFKLQELFNQNKTIYVEVIEKVSNIKDILNIENKYLSTLKPDLNIAKDATAPMKHRKHSQKTLDKLKNRKVWNKGIPRTAKDRKNIGLAVKTQYQNLTEEQKNKRRAFWKERWKIYKHPNLGKPMPKENIEAIRQTRIKKSIPFKCIETNEIFYLQNDAAKKYKIRQGHISENLKGKRPNVKGYTFQYIKKGKKDGT